MFLGKETPEYKKKPEKQGVNDLELRGGAVDELESDQGSSPGLLLVT